MKRLLGLGLFALLPLSLPTAARGEDVASPPAAPATPAAAPAPTGAGSATEGSRVRFVVVQPSHTDKIPPDVALHQTIELIATRMVDVVGEAEMTEAQKACGDENCLRALLKTTGATHAIVLRFEPPDANIVSHASLKVFSMVDPAYYASTITDTFGSPAEFEKRIAQDAATLADQVVARAKTAKNPPPPAYRPLPERVWPWALVGGGAVAMGWGIHLLTINGQGGCDHDPCITLNDSRNRGLVFVVAGAVAATGSLFLMYQLSKPVSVALSPSSIALTGSF